MQNKQPVHTLSQQVAVVYILAGLPTAPRIKEVEEVCPLAVAVVRPTPRG